MKTILFNVLVVIVVIGVALPMVGGTLATWSDSETMEGNYIETGSLDLLVNGQDDEPWGDGLEPCFNIPELELCDTRTCYRLLWNAGCVDGVAYLHIKDVQDSNGLSANTIMDIWYDHDGDPTTDLVLVESDTIDDLACEEIELGVLPGEAERQLKLEIHAYSGAPGDSLTFDINFELVQLELFGPTYAWADTEQSLNYLALDPEFGGSPGFWSGPGALNYYDESDIVSWFRDIVLDSNWYTDVTLTYDLDEDYLTVRRILNDTGAAEYEGMVNQFRSQYMATLLNALSGRLDPATSHDVDIDTVVSATLEDIIMAIEDTAEGDIYAEPPLIWLIELMKDVCDDLNNLRI